MAQGYYNNFTHSDNSSSAGLNPLTPQQYQHPGSVTIQVMKEDGIDVSLSPVRFLTQHMMDQAGHIYVLTNSNDCPNYLLNSNKVSFWKVDDPSGKQIEEFRKIQDLIKSKIQNIVKPQD